MAKKIIDINLSPDERKLQAKIKLVWRSLLFFICLFLFLIFYLQDEVNSLISYIVSLFLGILGMVYLYKTRKPDPLFVFFGYAGSIIALSSLWFVPEANHYSDFVWLTMCIFVSFMGGNKWSGAILLMFNIIGIAFYIFLVKQGELSVIQELTLKQSIGVFVEVSVSMVIFGYLLYQFYEFQSVWEHAYKKTNIELKEKNKTIQNQYDENVILVKEIHHRVKNNLQIIVSLLRLQKNELKTDEAKAQFQEAINRVLVMSSIHQKLYTQNNLNHINLKNHLEQLIEELKQLYSYEQEIDIKVNSTVEHVDLKNMVPLGLLFNELLSNSFKYAFEASKKGFITLDITKTEVGFRMVYSDNGKWIEAKDESGFGMELIEVFTNQLNGTRQLITNEKGSTYIFDLQFSE